MLPSLLLVLACSNPMEITSIEPNEIVAGEVLKIYGQNLDAESTVRLLGGKESGVTASEVGLAGDTLEVTVPKDTPAGRYDVYVDGGGSSKVLRNALAVKIPESENPCDTPYEVNTSQSFERHDIIIWHTYPDGKRETHKLAMDELKQIEFEVVKTGPETSCSVIYLRAADGTRWIYDRDEDMDLSGRASRFAISMGKPIEITRMDVELKDLEKPIEAR